MLCDVRRARNRIDFLDDDQFRIQINALVIGKPDRPVKTVILECDQLQAFIENH